MKKTKKIAKAVRNWLIGIIGVSLGMGLILSVLISLLVMVLDLIHKEKIEFFKLIGFSIVLIGISCGMIVFGIFLRLFNQIGDRDSETTEKIKKLNQSDLNKAFESFLNFFC